ncbi:MAG: carboxypeptidase regulatory-like domain-containing protein, partial [Pseudomonadota bacterium]|nr:carboxypeptidase regulatory-like domain-containing protein [Pseudomonadota bacterium]
MKTEYRISLPRVLIVFTVGCAALAGCDDSDVVVRDSEPVVLTGTLQGQVIDAFTQAPVEGATVAVLIDGEMRTAATGADGGFVFDQFPVVDDVDPDNPLRLTVTNAPGFATGFADALLARNAAEDPNAGLIANVVIPLHPTGGTISGTVVNPASGDPIAGAEVVLQAEDAGFVVPTPTAATAADGTFAFADAPQVALYDIRIIAPGFATVVYDDVFLPGGSVVDLNTLEPTAGGFLVGGQGIGPNPSAASPEGDFTGPFTTAASITPDQDLAMAMLGDDITIRFNEPLAAVNLDQIRLERLGFKGGAVEVGANAFADVPVATSLSADGRTLIVNPDQPLEPGMVFAVTGFESLFDANLNLFDPFNPNNFLPLVNNDFEIILVGTRALRFSTNADADLLALSAAPRQVANSAQNGVPFGFVGSLNLDFSAQAPAGARAFEVFAAPGGSVADPA